MDTHRQEKCQACFTDEPEVDYSSLKGLETHLPDGVPAGGVQAGESPPLLLSLQGD